VMTEMVIVARIPNHKADVNNYGSVSTDHIGASWDYPNASYARREEIWRDHVSYVQGFFYFLANDPRVPKPLQDEINQWGLAKDEFVDTGHWPHQLYVREARRMVGEFVVTQKDLQTDRSKPDPIGMGSYNSDSHNVQRIINEQGFVENEGDMQVPVEPYQIPYRVMLPKRTEATNVLVPVAFSASHVAYSSLRMEPQYMIIGHAAGVAAKMAIEAGVIPHEIDTRALTRRLVEQGAVMEYVPSPQVKSINLFRRLFCGEGGRRRGWSSGQREKCP
ncbi:MAG TPA: FAD-dependent oxidoreductase, partial [Bryobacterales bacterium]|nr:FAD-dependent oxidoreductase [Bryobacterales bacterium]